MGGFWHGGILTGGISSRGILARGDFVLGDFVRGGFVRGDFVQGDFVLSPCDWGDYTTERGPERSFVLEWYPGNGSVSRQSVKRSLLHVRHVTVLIMNSGLLCARPFEQGHEHVLSMP